MGTYWNGGVPPVGTTRVDMRIEVKFRYVWTDSLGNVHRGPLSQAGAMQTVYDNPAAGDLRFPIWLFPLPFNSPPPPGSSS